LMGNILFAQGQEYIGLVLDEETKMPVPFAKVELIDLHLNSRANIDGVFKFNKLPEVTLALKIEALDYSTLVQRVKFVLGDTVRFEIIPKHTVFEEVVVSASEGKLQSENITAIEYRSKETIFETGATTLGEALVNIPGVQQNTIGVGISRPVIRGLTGMRIVTLWNGLRIENQQWGEDHGMASSELGLQGVEVVKGPSSLLYGSDALAGVIYYHDESFLPAHQSEITASSRLETNSMGSTSELGYRSNNGKIKFNTHANFLSHADFQLPDGRFLESSRFWSANLKSALGFRKDNYIFTARYHGSYNRIGIPGHSHDVDQDVENYMNDRRGLRSMILPVQYIFNHLALIEQKVLFSSSDLTIQTGYSSNHLREFDHDPSFPFLNMKLQNITYNVKYNFDFAQNWNLKTGIQGMYQMNRNSRPTDSYLVPDANSFDFGSYALLNYGRDKWRFQAGVRYDIRDISSFETPQEYAQNISAAALDRTFQTLNFSSGLMRKGKTMTTRFNVSSGYRAPHYSELLAEGVHHGSLRYEKGDVNLVPEQAIQLDLGFEFKFDHLELFVNPYVSFVNNYIFLQGIDSVITASSGEYTYFEFQQVDAAVLYGGEVGFHYHPHKLHRLHLSSDFSLTIAEDQSANPISLIPQPNLNTRIRFDINNKQKFKLNFITLEHQYFLDQNRVGLNEAPTEQFHLINATASLSYGERFGGQIGVRNLLNTEYISHLSPLKNLGSGIPQPGINFFVKLTYRFDFQKK